MDVRRWKVFRGVDPSLMSKCKLAKFVNWPKVGFLVLENEDVYVVTEKDSNEGAVMSQVSKLESLCGKGTVDFYGTKWGFAALTKDGSVYSWMDSQATGPHPDNVPTKVSFSDLTNSCQASQLINGPLHFLCLTSDGQVFCWEENDRTLLGLGSGAEWHPRKVPGFSGHIVQVAAGPLASYALDSLGRVWSWGSGDSLGYHAAGDQCTPKLIDNLDNIKKVAAGYRHVLALSATGELYFWGNFDDFVLPRKRIEIMEPVTDIGAIVNSPTVVCQTKDKVYLWGLWYCSRISEPMETKFTSIDEAYACANTPRMLQPVTMNVQPHGVEDAWKGAFDDPSTSDIIFSIGNEKLHAHVVFLKLRNEYFRGMFDNDWGESRKKDAGPIEIHGFSFRVFKAFIYFLYHESLIDPNMSVEDLAELMRAADFYRDDALRLACEKKLKSQLTPENACFVYTSAVQSNAESLQAYTVEFMAPVYKQIFKSAEFATMGNDCKTKLMAQFADLDLVQVSKKRRLQ